MSTDSPRSHPVPSWIRRGRLRWVWGLWEPLMFYRRSGHMAAYSPGNALWTDAWYERMHSREMVEKLADLGVNCLSTHFYKGFGRRAEAAEMERAAAFTALCHEYGIRVLGYLQWATICYETFLDEVPHAKDWVQRDADGRLVLYGSGTYWRWLGCQQHEAYVAYLGDIVRFCLAEARMDGIEWDGTVYRCHCDLCQERFRAYLECKYAGVDPLPLFGLPHFRHVRLPASESRVDPLFQEVTPFRVAFMEKRLAAYNDLVKSINPEAAQVTYFIDPAREHPSPSVDIIVDENHDAPFFGGEVLTTRCRGLKQGFALDRLVLSTSWLRKPSARTAPPPEHLRTEADLAAFGMGGSAALRRPETAAEVALDVAEPAMYGGHLVTPTWALRSVGGGAAAFEEPELHGALRRYLHFFRDHEALFDVAASLATVGVLRGHASLTLDFFNSFPCVIGMEQVCLQHQIPFDMVTALEPDRIARHAALVLAEQTCLSDAEIAALRAFVEQGGGLVISGRTGLYDERFRQRRRHPLEPLFGLPRVEVLRGNPERLSTPKRDHHPAHHDMRLPAASPDIAAAVVCAAGGRLPWRVETERFVTTEGYRIRDGRRVIHLLNYRNETPVGPLDVTLAADWAAGRVRLLSPDDGGQDDVLTPVGDGAPRYRLERLSTYALLVIEPAAGVAAGAGGK